jgi:hypothetical protein
MGDAVVALARLESERRRKAFPGLVRGGGDAEALTLNYQAWCAIADWLGTGRCAFINSWGGVAEPPVTVIDWPLLADAARKELEAVEAKLGQQEDEELRARRDCLFCIHLAVSRRREWLDETNRMLRSEAAQRLEAA